MMLLLHFFAALNISLPPLSPPPYTGKFARCAPYERELVKAVKTWWPELFQYPKAWAAQLYQESLCDPSAVSPVGARGLAQFMPATARDVGARFGLTFNPHDDIAIEYGAYYQAKQMAFWTSRRPQHERWRLGAASYNAGFGNILEAQARCNDARMWRDVSPCLPQVTGHHASETQGYVRRIEQHWRAMARGPWDMPEGL